MVAIGGSTRATDECVPVLKVMWSREQVLSLNSIASRMSLHFTLVFMRYLHIVQMQGRYESVMPVHLASHRRFALFNHQVDRSKLRGRVCLRPGEPTVLVLVRNIPPRLVTRITNSVVYCSLFQLLPSPSFFLSVMSFLRAAP